MKKYTIDELKAICCTDRAAFRDIINAAKARRMTLVETVEENRTEGPAQTVAALIERLGHAGALAAISEMIAQTNERDGRISQRARELGTLSAMPAEWLRDSYMPLDCIHPAHRDQIARAALDAHLTSWELAEAADIAAEAEARRAELADVPEWVHDPGRLNGRYDYHEAIAACVLSSLIDDGYITKGGRVVDDLTREELEERLNDELWIDDAVTGNGSGSFFVSSWRAETALRGNCGLLAEVLREFGQDGVDVLEEGADVLEEGAEAMDVTIRCFLLSGCIAAALDRLEAEGLISYGD